MHTQLLSERSLTVALEICEGAQRAFSLLQEVAVLRDREGECFCGVTLVLSPVGWQSSNVYILRYLLHTACTINTQHNVYQNVQLLLLLFAFLRLPLPLRVLLEKLLHLGRIYELLHAANLRCTPSVHDESKTDHGFVRVLYIRCRLATGCGLRLTLNQFLLGSRKKTTYMEYNCV